MVNTIFTTTTNGDIYVNYKMSNDENEVYLFNFEYINGELVKISY